MEGTVSPNPCGASSSSKGNVQRVSVPGVGEAPVAADSAMHDDAERAQDDMGIPVATDATIMKRSRTQAEDDETQVPSRPRFEIVEESLWEFDVSEVCSHAGVVAVAKEGDYEQDSRLTRLGKTLLLGEPGIWWTKEHSVPVVGIVDKENIEIAHRFTTVFDTFIPPVISTHWRSSVRLQGRDKSSSRSSESLSGAKGGRG